MNLTPLFSYWRDQYPSHSARNIRDLTAEGLPGFFYAEVARGKSGRQKVWNPTIIKRHFDPQYRTDNADGARWEEVGLIRNGQQARRGLFVVEARNIERRWKERATVSIPKIDAAQRLLLVLVKEFYA